MVTIEISPFQIDSCHFITKIYCTRTALKVVSCFELEHDMSSLHLEFYDTFLQSDEMYRRIPRYISTVRCSTLRTGDQNIRGDHIYYSLLPNEIVMSLI